MDIIPPPIERNIPPIPRVYLAGKMGTNNFRNTLGLGPRDMSVLNGMRNHKGRAYIYAGPIVPSCDHGCWHDMFNGEVFYECGTVSNGEQRLEVIPNQHHAIVGATISQIQNSDLVFAWFDSFDAYGSIAEIGMAVGMGIPVYIGFREDVFPETSPTTNESYSWKEQKRHLPGQELWYVATLAHQVFATQTADVAFSRALRGYALGKQCPLWKPFLDAHIGILLPGEVSI